MELTTDQKGEIAVARVIIRAAQKGCTVSKTQEGARYDLILDDGELHRIQVKYCGMVRGGAICVHLMKDKGNKGEKRRYLPSEVDAIVAYAPVTDRLYWFGPDVFADRNNIAARYERPKNGQVKGVINAADYEW